MGAGYADLSRTQFRQVQRLANRRGREQAGRFLAEGTQAVREAIARPGTVETLIVDDPDRHREFVGHLAPDRVRVALRDDVAKLTDTVTSQGVFAVCRPVDVGLDVLDSPRLVVICAQVRDPGNAGTVIRCADAFGADAVILSAGSVELYNPKTVRASVGSIFHLPIVTGIELADAVGRVRGLGLQVLAADGQGEGLDDLARRGELAAPTAWIMGNEAWGLPDADARLADRIVGVPMWGHAESLNLSTAAAVCLYATASAQHDKLGTASPVGPLLDGLEEER